MEEKRIEMAVSLFKEGFNCSQAVVAAFADQYGFTTEQALRMSASFGGGIGRIGAAVLLNAAGRFLRGRRPDWRVGRPDWRAVANPHDIRFIVFHLFTSFK